MASEAQIQANRQNAKRSTGPRSRTGRRRSARNSATRGGISGSGKIFSPQDRSKVRRLMKVIARELPPGTPYEKKTLRRAAVEHYLMERCESQLSWLYHDVGETARENWDTFRRNEAEQLIAKIHRSPGVTTLKLEMTPQGCEVKAERWEALGLALDRKG